MIYVIGKKNQNLTLQLTEKALEISEVAAEMAVRLSASLLTDCIALSVDNGRLQGLRPSLDGKSFSHYAFSDDQPTVIVVKDTGITEPRQNLLQSCVKVAELSASAPGNTAEKCPGNHTAPGKIVFVRKIIHENVSKDIKDAPLIFAGGRGLMNEQSFEALRRLADFLTPQLAPPDLSLTAAGQGLQNKSARPAASSIPKCIWPSASPELSSIWPA